MKMVVILSQEKGTVVVETYKLFWTLETTNVFCFRF